MIEQLRDRLFDKPVALRCAAGPKLGLGHVVRMASLAHYLPGACLVVDGQTANSLDELKRPLPPVRVIPLGHTPGRWVEAPGMGDIGHVVLDTLFAGNIDATAEEVESLRRAGREVTVIDSMPPDHFMPKSQRSASTWPNLIVTPYIGSGKLRPAINGVRWLHGASYAMFSPEFLVARERQKERALPNRILVTCGGADPLGLSARILSALSGGDVPVDVIVGPMFSRELKERLTSLSKSVDNVWLRDAPDSLLPFIEASGIILGRPGLTRYEAACLGRPAIYLVEGVMYREYFKAFSDAGIAEIFFADGHGQDAAFFDRVGKLHEDTSIGGTWVRNERAQALVDGRGARRVADAINAGQH